MKYTQQTLDFTLIKQHNKQKSTLIGDQTT